MPDSEDYQRDVAGRFMQAMRNTTFNFTHRLFPEMAPQATDIAERMVEEGGLLVESIEVIRHWFRSDADAEWLDRFWKTPEGSRFLDLIVELTSRSMYRRFLPDVPVPPPGHST